MIAIMISDKPKWCVKMMNGEKKVIAQKNNTIHTDMMSIVISGKLLLIWWNIGKRKIIR